MDHEVAERRPSLRISPRNGMIVALHVSVPVRLLGLSPAGLLLACKVPLRAGSTVRVVTGPAGRRLETELCVDQVSDRPDDGIGGYVLCGKIPSSCARVLLGLRSIFGKDGRRRVPRHGNASLEFGPLLDGRLPCPD